MDYKKAGVNIAAGTKAKNEIKKLVRKTFSKNVLSEVGVFGSMFELKGYKNPVLVSSVDSVGSKVKLAFMTNKHDTVGIDMVGHSVNDILVQGAIPLFFLDYLGMNNVNPLVVRDLVKGMTKACKDNKCALIGGETAEIPDLYSKNEYDLVGCIVGVVEKNKIINGKKIKPGDVIIGVKSTGLHTNGYTLARKVLNLKDKKVVKELMKPHKSYLKEYLKVKDINIKGMAHITGGGLIDNVPRILPKNCCAKINVNWTIPWIFKEIQKKGKIKDKEMFKVFNMGIGYVFIVSKKDAAKVAKKAGGKIIGEIVKGKGVKLQ